MRTKKKKGDRSGENQSWGRDFMKKEVTRQWAWKTKGGSVPTDSNKQEEGTQDDDRPKIPYKGEGNKGKRFNEQNGEGRSR